MPDRSTTHSARLDDEMAAETESLTRGAPVEAHAEEWAMAEPPGDGEPVPGSVVEFAVGDAASGALDENERRRRSELAVAIPPHAFPGDRGALVRAAEESDAPEWVIDALGTLPIDTRFDTSQDVWSALGGHREARVSEPVATAADAPSETQPSLPPPPPGLDVMSRVAGIAGAGVGIASAVVGGTVGLIRRVLGSLRR